MAYTSKYYAPGAPNSKVARFTTGKANPDYNYCINLVSRGRVQIRHNALEAARVAANKKLVSLGEEGYLLTVKTYPHIILRENKMIATAGADRLQEGMRKAFGKPIGLAALRGHRQHDTRAPGQDGRPPAGQERAPRGEGEAGRAHGRRSRRSPQGPHARCLAADQSA